MSTERDPEHLNTPTILDLLNAPEDRQIVELVLNRMLIGRPFIAPPGMPPERLALMRTAFRQAVDDRELRAEADKLRLAIDPMWGDEAQQVIMRLYQTPPQVVERTRKIVAFTPDP